MTAPRKVRACDLKPGDIVSVHNGGAQGTAWLEVRTVRVDRRSPWPAAVIVSGPLASTDSNVVRVLRTDDTVTACTTPPIAPLHSGLRF